ncbi:MAG: hypothetical protein AAAC47_12475 [Pararhizobium sp.]
MDASDCKEINICDIEPSGAKIGKNPKKYPLSALLATKMSHFHLSPAADGGMPPMRIVMRDLQFATYAAVSRVSETDYAAMGGAIASRLVA